MSDIGEIRLGPLGSVNDLTIAAQELADKENEVIRGLLELAARKITWEDVAEKPEVFPPDLSKIPSGGEGQLLNSVLWVNVEEVPTTLEGFHLLEEVQSVVIGRVVDKISAHSVDTSNVHGIPNTSLLETLAGAQAKVDAGMIVHLAEADPHPQYLEEAEADTLYDAIGAAPAAVAAHSALADPHLQYHNDTRGDARYSQLGHQHVAGDVTSGTFADARIPATIARYTDGSTKYNGDINVISTAAGIQIGKFGGGGAFRMDNGSFDGWTIYANAGDGNLYFENDSGGMVGFDSSGNMIVGLVPGTTIRSTYAQLYQTVAQAIPSAANTVLTLDTVGRDTDGMYNVGTPDRVTIPVGMAGLWTLDAGVAFASNATGQRRMGIRVNGTTFVSQQRIPPITIAASATVITTAATVELAVGDYLEVVVYQDTGAALNTNVTVSSYNRLAATFLGTLP
jgi:hypothetical protein